MNRRRLSLAAACLACFTVAASAQSLEPNPVPADAPTSRPAAAAPLRGDKFPMMGGEATSGIPTGTAFVGRVAVQAVQGTPGGPKIFSVPVEVQLVHRGMIVDTLEAELDEHGVVVLEDLALSMAVQPVVVISYGGVMYQRTGEVLDPAHPEQKIEVVCYELTEERPDWVVTMRHLMVAPAEEGVRVTEIMVINNPAERTWVGDPGANPEDRRTTNVIELPSGAGHVALGRGFHDWCCTTFEGGRLINHLPIMPGSSELSFSYIVHEESGKAAIDVVAPANVGHTMLMVPLGMTAGSTDGLTSGGTRTMGEASMQLFTSSNLKAGARSRIVLTGLAASQLAASPNSGHALEAAATGNTIKLIAAIGGGLILLIAIVVIFVKSPGAARTTGAPREECAS